MLCRRFGDTYGACFVGSLTPVHEIHETLLISRTMNNIRIYGRSFSTIICC